MLLPIGDINPTSRFPVVNKLLLAANVAIGLFSFLAMAPAEYAAVVRSWGFVPAEGRGAAWTLVTSQFLHGGFAHLAGNMLFLWIAGDNVEDKLGRAGYLVFYLLSGVAAGLVHGAMNPASEIPCVGASGAISGVLAAYALLFPRARIKILYFLPIFVFIHWGTFTVRSVWAIGFWFLQQILFAVQAVRLAERFGDLPGVAYGAHVGGFVFGLACAIFLIGFGLVRRRR